MSAELDIALDLALGKLRDSVDAVEIAKHGFAVSLRMLHLDTCDEREGVVNECKNAHAAAVDTYVVMVKLVDTALAIKRKEAQP